MCQILQKTKQMWVYNDNKTACNDYLYYTTTIEYVTTFPWIKGIVQKCNLQIKPMHTFCFKSKRSHSETEPSILDENNRPQGKPLEPARHHTSEEILELGSPWIVWAINHIKKKEKKKPQFYEYDMNQRGKSKRGERFEGTSWQCQPTEPGETSQISREPSSRAAATWESSALVARATTGDGFQSIELFL